MIGTSGYIVISYYITSHHHWIIHNYQWLPIFQLLGVWIIQSNFHRSLNAIENSHTDPQRPAASSASPWPMGVRAGQPIFCCSRATTSPQLVGRPVEPWWPSGMVFLSGDFPCWFPGGISDLEKSMGENASVSPHQSVRMFSGKHQRKHASNLLPVTWIVHCWMRMDPMPFDHDLFGGGLIEIHFQFQWCVPDWYVHYIF